MSVFTHPPFRWLVAGNTVNLLGNGLAIVALAFAVLDLGGSATHLGLVEAAYAGANVLAVLLGGVLGDRLPRRAVMQGANAAAAVVQGVLAASLIGGWGSIGLTAALGAANGALSALSGPAANAVTRQTVPPALLPRAISVSRLAKNVAMILGFGVAGLVVAAIGSGWALALDAMTFAVASFCFSRVRVPHTPPAERTNMVADAREGFAEVLRHSWLWALIAMAAVYHLFFGGAQGVLGPIVVSAEIGRPAWGWALASMMIGFVCGGLVTLVWRPRRALFAGTTLLALTAFFPAAMAFSDQLWPLLIGAFLHGFGLEIFSVFWDLSIQQNVPEDKLARVYSVDLLGSFLVRPLGLALTGPVSAVVGTREWLGVISAVLLACGLLPLLLGSVRRLERRNDPAEGVAPVAVAGA